MTEDTATLVERVRSGLLFSKNGLAALALTELAERLEAASDLAQTGRESVRMLALRERDYAAAEARVAELEEALRGLTIAAKAAGYRPNDHPTQNQLAAAVEIARAALAKEERKEEQT